jgi:hypothetical protein
MPIIGSFAAGSKGGFGGRGGFGPPYTLQYLVVAGGGAGGWAGAGAGGFRTSCSTVDAGKNLTITVGAGGATGSVRGGYSEISGAPFPSPFQSTAGGGASQNSDGTGTGGNGGFGGSGAGAHRKWSS